MMQEIWLGDCLELMKHIPDKSVDMILCDLPYEVTARQKWDTIIPFEPLWREYKRIRKDNCVIALFAIEPFRTKLICSNMSEFRYDLIWEKKQNDWIFERKKTTIETA